MNNLPLQPLVWDVHEVAATINMTAESPLHSYTIYPDQYEGGYVIYYFERMTNESGHEYFNSSDEAQNWAQFTHYPSKMQPYVKPTPTWIDVNERLPERKELLTDKDKCLVLTECGKVWTGFYNMHIKPDDWYLHGWTEKQGWHPFKIVAWMLASEFSTMQNNKGE